MSERWRLRGGSEAHTMHAYIHMHPKLCMHPMHSWRRAMRVCACVQETVGAMEERMIAMQESVE